MEKIVFDNPFISLNNEERLIEIKGNIVFDTNEQMFIFDTLNKYILENQNQNTLKLQIHYVDGNEGELFLLQILELLKKTPNFKVDWIFQKYNDDLKEYGQDLSKKSGLNFNFIET